MIVLAGALLFLGMTGSGPEQPGAVARIQAESKLVCGVDQSEAEYSMDEDHGPRVAFDKDLCRAVAVAIAGPHAQVVFKGYPDEETALAALRTGEVELVASVSKSFGHVADTRIGLTSTVLFDGVGLLTRTASNVDHVASLGGEKVCFLAETQVESTLRAGFASRHIDLLPFPFQEEGEMEAAYISHNCVALAADLTRLGSVRAAFGDLAGEHIILPETFGADPMAMAYRSSDAQLGRIAEWTLQVLLAAEEDAGAGPENSVRAQRLLGATKEFGKPLGLRDTWPHDVLQAVGDYSQIFERDLGSGSPLKLPRGLNRLCSQGGAMCAQELK